jgi:DNA-binding CsgD family transcriptional regulator
MVRILGSILIFRDRGLRHSPIAACAYFSARVSLAGKGKNGRYGLASNVLKLRAFEKDAQAQSLYDKVSINHEADIRAAANAIHNEVSDHGLRIMLWHDLGTMEPMMDADGSPLDASVFGWAEQELSPWRDYDKAMRSPFLRACRVEHNPFWVNRHGFQPRPQSPLLNKIELHNVERLHHVKAAIIIPIHLSFGQVAAAVLTSTDTLKNDLSEEFAKCMERLAPAILKFVGGYVRTRCDQRYLPQETQLTRREIECLSWVANGKTDFEISIILGCTHSGVRYLVSRACEKLGAVNRAQTVFRACQLGYLGSPLDRVPRRGAAL